MTYSASSFCHYRLKDPLYVCTYVCMYVCMYQCRILALSCQNQSQVRKFGIFQNTYYNMSKTRRLERLTDDILLLTIPLHLLLAEK